MIAAKDLRNDGIALMSTREAIEFMADNVLDNVRGVVMEPVKRFLVRERK